jgi:hypothetical protein
MARRTPETDAAEAQAKAEEMKVAKPEDEARAATIGMPGGAPGLIIEQAAKEIPSTAGTGTGNRDDSKGPRRFRVAGTPPRDLPGHPILYGGCRSYMQVGKIITEATYDVEYLRAQGVPLEEMK